MIARILSGVGLAAVLALYLATLPVNHSEAEDSLHYAAVAGHGSLSEALQVHGNHLAFGMLSHLAVTTARVMGYIGAPDLPLQLLNVAAAMLAFFLLNGILARVEVVRLARVTAIAAFALSFGIWHYSGATDVYVVFLVSQLAGWRLVVEALDEAVSLRRAAAIGACLGLTLLVHQLGIVVLLAGAIALFRVARGFRSGGQAMLAALTAGASVALAIYVVIGMAVLGLDAGGLAAWIGGPAVDGTYGQPTVSSPVRGIVGAARSVVGAHFLFAIPPIAERVAAGLSNAQLMEELFLVSRMSTRVATGLALSAGLCSLSIVGLAVGARRDQVAELPDRARRFCRDLVLPHLVLAALIATWWDPDNHEFWLPLLPGAAVLLACVLHRAGLGAPDQRPATRVLSLLMLAGLLVANLFGTILPLRDPTLDYWRVSSGWLLKEASPRDLVLTSSGWVAKGYIEVYSGASVFDTLRDDEEFVRDLQAAISSASPGRVYVSSTMAEPPPALVAWRGVDPDLSRRQFSTLSPRLRERHRGRFETFFELISTSDESSPKRTIDVR